LGSIVFPVNDLEAGKAVFTKLFGAEPHTDTPYYVGYNVNGLEIALNPDARASGQATAVVYWAVKDLHATVDGLIEAGATVVTDPAGVGGGTSIATVANPDGNLIGLISGPDQD
jgi:predicted enzyme related to lactoylglutathione lyase